MCQDKVKGFGLHRALRYETADTWRKLMGDQRCLGRIVLETEVSINPTPPPPPDGRERTGTQRESRTLHLAEE